MQKRLNRLINSQKAKICVVGLGYVGLPIATEFAKRGFFVYGFDTQASRVRRLKDASSYISDISSIQINKKEGAHPDYGSVSFKGRGRCDNMRANAIKEQEDPGHILYCEGNKDNHEIPSCRPIDSIGEHYLPRHD